jgi:hypothetical protein
VPVPSSHVLSCALRRRTSPIPNYETLLNCSPVEGELLRVTEASAVCASGSSLIVTEIIINDGLVFRNSREGVWPAGQGERLTHLKPREADQLQEQQRNA